MNDAHGPFIGLEHFSNWSIAMHSVVPAELDSHSIHPQDFVLGYFQSSLRDFYTPTQ